MSSDTFAYPERRGLRCFLGTMHRPSGPACRHLRLVHDHLHHEVITGVAHSAYKYALSAKRLRMKYGNISLKA